MQSRTTHVLLRLTALALTLPVHQAAAAPDTDSEVIASMRRQKSALLSKRHDMNNPEKRAALVRELRKNHATKSAAVRRKAIARGLPLEGDKPGGGHFRLIDFDENDNPVYEETQNVNAATTTAADEVRSNTTYNGVDGSSVTIGLWESGGVPLLTHQELEGHVTIMDDSTTTPNHATHVAGTLVAQGINSATLGMAPGASIAAFDSSGAEAEMMAYGASEPGSDKLYLSNHSYGSTRGWKIINDVWYFAGTFSNDGDNSNDYEDDFGRYNSRSEEWDGIAYNLPYYLIFVSAGNQRTDTTPDVGETWKSGWDEYSYDPTQHPLSSRDYKDGWDNMEGGTLAKNVLAVGSADEGIDSNGNRDPGEATAESYSSRGPADDGRIKPDIYGNGSGLKSSIASSNTATASYSGTSMSSPNVCGSAALLIDYYSSRFPAQAMRASTLKALILHTADDRGKTGPDYKYGWGIMNTRFAADVIKQHADGSGGGHMLESIVDDSANTSRTHTFAWDGGSPLRVTLCWTDPPGSEIDDHDSRESTLVNDLNLKVTGPDGTHYPYVMPFVGDWSLASIDDAATTGVNHVDTVEQVYLADPTPGDYTITVDYAGPLTNELQEYSLVITGQAQPENELMAWRWDHFQTSANSGSAADTSDPDADGLVNLIEFALGTDPAVPTPQPLAVATTSSQATLNYQRSISAMEDLDISVTWSDSLSAGTWRTADITETIIADDGVLQQVQASLPTSNAGHRFFRIQISEK
ncbi:MAG: S8 family serine peptidase [Verrucomicrobiota bacterium JB025]|nr:S8 family serine peptidase [Verrucomicrobiota bacterium JB025]